MGHKGTKVNKALIMLACKLVIAALSMSANVEFGYLLAVVGGILHTHQVSVWPSVKVSVLSANMAISSIAWLALTAEHGVRVDAQVDAVCIFMAVVATILARVAGFANLKEIPQYSENGLG